MPTSAELLSTEIHADKKLNSTIEFVRLGAVILITFSHLRHNFSEGIVYFILEEIPRYGTLVLSVVSGYLFLNVEGYKQSFLKKKVKSLLFPYLIANFAVLVPVILFNMAGYNFLNRLQFDFTLFTEGMLSLSSPPINPPTYFIRDLFVVFMLLDLVLNRNFKLIVFLVPLAIFGELLLRWDILFMFAAGAAFSGLEIHLKKKMYFLWMSALAAGLVVLFTFYQIDYSRHVISFMIFALLITLPPAKAKVRTGGYSYMVHLYHSPIIVSLYPLISSLQIDAYSELLLQLALVFLIVWAAFRITIRWKWIRGGR
ncbi:MAG: hypothetical protein ACK40G_10920 [Cytophagaceae bacterium]